MGHQKMTYFWGAVCWDFIEDDVGKKYDEKRVRYSYTGFLIELTTLVSLEFSKDK